jgi:trimeric autotransporter adhesin
VSKLTQLLSACGLLLLAFSSPAFAQTAPAGNDTSAEVTTETFPSFSPRLGVRYNTKGSGYDAFTSFEGFVPLLQTPGKNVTFLEGRLLLDDKDYISGNLVLGHRILSDSGKRVIGTYVSFDKRNTGSNAFNQVGLGFESLGDVDFRANAYLPVDNGRRPMNDGYTGGAVFSGNNLFLQRQYETALHGIDAEIGTRLTRLGSGDIRAYAGGYYYGGDNIEDTFGWKARLAANPTDALNLNITVQNDPLFNTSALFTIGFTFPGSGASRAKTDQERLIARMADFTERQAIIPVARDVQIDFSQPATIINPAAAPGQQTRFIQVAAGGTATGTAESPLDADGLAGAVTSATPGTIVYVNGAPNVPLANTLTVPAGVQLLSSGPVQTVNTVEAGNIRLPGSGSGLFPVLKGTPLLAGNGLVRLSSNTTVSGFDVIIPTTGFVAPAGVPTNVDARGIVGSGISNVTIANNFVSNARREAIDLSEVTGNVAINNNTVRDSGVNNSENAIRVSNSRGTVALGIANNTITNNNGVAVSLSGTAQGTATVENNSISTTRTGISLRASETANLTSIARGNTINGTSASREGIASRTFDTAQANTTISGNTISNMASGVLLEASDSAKPQITVSGNTIDRSRTNGINANAIGNSELRANVSGNTISNTTGIGVEGNAANAAKLRLGLTSNTIRNSGSLGVSVTAADTSDVSVIANSNTLTNNNTVTGAQNPATPSAFDVAADPFSLGNKPKVCVRLNGNTGTGNTVADYSLYNGNSATNGATFQVENSVFSTNTGRITLQAFNGAALVPATVVASAIGSTNISTGSGFTSVASGTCVAP